MGICVKFVHETADLLTLEGRRLLLRRLLEQPAAKTVEENALTVDARPMETAIRRGLNMLEKAKKVVVIDKDVPGGTPCFKGTRIPVRDIAAMVVGGDEKSTILKAYPQLTA